MKATTRLYLLAVVITGLSFGQTTMTQLSGTVTDPSNAVVPGVEIVVTNVATGIQRTTSSNELGYYTVPLLPPGAYRVVAQKAGFRPLTRSGITLHVNQAAALDLVLELGQSAQEISVSGDAPLLTVNEATQGQVIDNRKMVNLPLNGRDYVQLALLSAGTNVHPGARVGGFSGSGMRASQNSYLLDGMDNNNLQVATQSLQGEALKPGVDAIQEFKVMTNTFSAEYGRAAGAVVSVSIKAGTNELHGTAFEFLRNEKLDAKNFFDKGDVPKPGFKRNQFGFSLGGPIKKNKTFFFGDYEWTKIRESRTVLSTIPTPRMVQGDFAELLPTKIYDPATYDAATRLRQPFPGNSIPASRIDPIGGKLASMYPAPNRTGLTRNFIYNPPDRQNVDRWDTKIDHTFGPGDSLYARFSFQRVRQPGSPDLPPPAYGGTNLSRDRFSDGRSFMMAYNHLFSPSLINSMRAGWNRILGGYNAPVKTNLNRELGLKGVDTFLAGGARFNVAGNAGLGLAAFAPIEADSQVRQFMDDVTWMHGRHIMKFGANLSWLQSYMLSVEQAIGLFSFDTSFSRNPVSLAEGSAVADLLMGAAYTAEVSDLAYVNERAPYYDFFAQDEWRVTPRLTVNLGLRYELHLPWVETRNGWSNFDLDSNPLKPELVLAKNGSRFDRATIATDANNWGPRVGLAFRATSKTVIRTGYGVYYAQPERVGGAEYLPDNPPFHYRVTLSTDRIRPNILLRDGLPPNLATAKNAKAARTASFDRGGRLPYAQQWSFSVQRELPADVLFEIGYYANTAHKLVQRLEGNWALPGPGDLNSRRRYTSVLVPRDNVVISPLAGTWRDQFSGNANFHSLQTRVEKRLSHGVSLLANYIWSKAISDSRGAAPAGGTAQIDPQNPRDLRAERSLADEHRAHRFVTSYVYDLPFGRARGSGGSGSRVLGGLLGGWSIAGITTLSSGPRVNLTVLGNPSNTGDPNRPNVSRPWRLDKSGRGVERWFDTGAFTANAPYTFGNAGRNLLEGPGAVNFDFAVYKELRVAEGKKLQFRGEGFNLFNTPPLGAPIAEVGNKSFGAITSADRPRNLQFGLKFVF